MLSVFVMQQQQPSNFNATFHCPTTTSSAKRTETVFQKKETKLFCTLFLGILGGILLGLGIYMQIDFGTDRRDKQIRHICSIFGFAFGCGFFVYCAYRIFRRMSKLRRSNIIKQQNVFRADSIVFPVQIESETPSMISFDGATINENKLFTISESILPKYEDLIQSNTELTSSLSYVDENLPPPAYCK